jgi:uncharacterized membrane protein
MSRTVKVWGIFVGVFLAGAVAGGLVGVRLTDAVVDRARQGERAKAPEQTNLMLLRMYASRLELTPAQIEQIRPAMDATGDQMRRLRQESAMSLQQLEESLEAVLEPEQRERLKAMQLAQKELWRKMVKLREAHRRPNGEGPPPGSPGSRPPPPEPAPPTP